MVYSSDYYNSRRPAYYKPASSYTYTPLYSSDGYDIPPTYYKAHQVYQTSTPFILTPAPTSTGKPSPNVLPYNGYPYTHHYYVPLHRRSAATMHGVIDRIEHRPRSHPSYDPTDEYLNSRSSTNFDDVTRDIRAQTAGLLKQVYTPTIRPKLSSVSNGYSEMPIAKRIESDAYIEKILSDSDSYRRDNNIGKGHLACVSYAGGRAYPKRRPHLSKEVDDNITMLSYYNKTREAVAASKPYPTVKINSAEKHTFNEKEDQAQANFSKNVDAKKESALLAAKEEAIQLAVEKKKAQLAAEKEKVRLEAEEEKLRLEAEEKARLEAEEQVRIEQEENARLKAEEEKLRLETEEKEKTRLAVEHNEEFDDEDNEVAEQEMGVTERFIESEVQINTDAGIGKSSTTTTSSTEIVNEEDDGIKTTATFQRTVTKTTTVTSSVITGDDDDSKVEINEVIEENSDSDEDKDVSEHLDVAQAEGQESSTDEDESDDEESEDK